MNYNILSSKEKESRFVNMFGYNKNIKFISMIEDIEKDWDLLIIDDAAFYSKLMVEKVNVFLKENTKQKIIINGTKCLFDIALLPDKITLITHWKEFPQHDTYWIQEQFQKYKGDIKTFCSDFEIA